MRKEWNGFREGLWVHSIDVRDFIQKNYTLYDKDESFLVGPTTKTSLVLKRCNELLKLELEKGVLDIDVSRISGVDVYPPGYIDKDNEVIFGLQTDAPLKRIVNPYGGIRMVEASLKAYGYKLEEEKFKDFILYRKTHNSGVYDAYTKEMRLARSSGLITGLPDAYGRGRIIGDYRRVALYGIDYLLNEKKDSWENLNGEMTDLMIGLREDICEQYRALEKVKKMALSYGIDISNPASNSKEAVQWLYFAYLAGVKENNGAATSLGRVSTFLDIYFERDLQAKLITEEEVQELIDQFVIKLRLVRHLRTPEYDELFSGDPTWVTEAIGGVGLNYRPLVTKTSFRFLHTLTNLSPAPEPNITILWSDVLPQGFKNYCAKMSIETDSIQYENDDLMRPIYGDDYGISCCVSAMKIGKQMQYFGARCNIAKALLYAINGGIDEKTGEKVLEDIEHVNDEVLEFNKVKLTYYKVLEKVAKLYANTMNVIHYMHDKYAYEASQMALHDYDCERLMAFGVAGLSVVADSLSAIKFAKVKPLRDENGLAYDFERIGEYPKFGNDNDAVDNIAVELLEKFYSELIKHRLHRNAKHTLSVLTITSNVVYGLKTGATPDGRASGVAFAPGANPMHGRDTSGALASLNSVAKLRYSDCCLDGISNTFSIVPNTLGSTKLNQIKNLVGILDGYFKQGGHHLNVNVLQRSVLEDAIVNPEKYPLLTIRVSGYAVRFNRLTKEQQFEVLSRTFHEKM